MSSHATSTLLKTSLLSGIVGAGLALLFAPRSGQETRKTIKNKTDELQHNAVEKMNSLRHKTDEKLGQMTDSLSEQQTLQRMHRDENRQSPILTNWEREV